MGLRALALAPLLLLACACRNIPPLNDVAARELPCNQGVAIERAGADGEIYRASGCGMRAYYYYTCFGTLGLECKWYRVAHRAVEDLRCPLEQIEYEGLERGIVRASGCGRETFYRRQCEGDVCGWRLTSDPRLRSTPQ
jgi:hypothetical protein